MRNNVSKKDNLHVIFGVWQRLGTRTKEHQDGFEKQKADNGEANARYDVQHYGVAKYVLGGVIVFLSQLYRKQTRRSHPYSCTKSGRKVHQRKGNGKSRDSQSTNALPDKDAINHVIE